MRSPLVLFLAVAAGWAQDQSPTIPKLLQTGNAAYMKGDYAAARESFAKAWELAQQTEQDDPIRYDIAKRLTSVHAASGEFVEADTYLQRAIQWRENAFGRNDPKVADDLLIEAGLYRGMKVYDRAREILGRVVGIHRQAFGPDSTAMADDFSRIGRIYMDEKKLQAAIGPLNTALEIRTKAMGPLDGSLIPDLDRLGSAHVAMRSYDQAEGVYRHALVIRETLLGKDDADLIASVDGLAYSCFGQKKYDEAEALYSRLIALWVKSVGEDHPMTALALDKLASFYVDRKKLEQAKELTDRAIAIRARFLALGLSVAATEQIQEQHMDAAIAMYRRAVNAMEPPHPLNAELQRDIGGMLKGLETPPPKSPSKAPPPQRKK